MKKILLPILAMLVLPLPGLPETDPQTVKFLEKVNLNYYCIQREADFKGFTCYAKLAVKKSFLERLFHSSPDGGFSAASEKMWFLVSVDGNGALMVEAKYPDKHENDWSVTVSNSISEAVLNAVRCWVGVTINPLYDEGSFADDCKIEKDTNGFKVVKTASDMKTIDNYDTQSKLISTDVGDLNGEITETREYDFEKTDNGLLLKSVRLKADEGEQKITYQYQSVGKYRPLKEAESVSVGSLFEKKPSKETGKLRAVIYFSEYSLTR